jgi:hypothetical protein
LTFRGDPRNLDLTVRLDLDVKEDDSVEVRRLELDVSLGEARVSVSVIYLLYKLHYIVRQG